MSLSKPNSLELTDSIPPPPRISQIPPELEIVPTDRTPEITHDPDKVHIIDGVVRDMNEVLEKGWRPPTVEPHAEEPVTDDSDFWGPPVEA